MFSLAEVGAAQLALVAAVAFGAAILGGIAGYGVGLILPIALAPAVGVSNVIPVMAVSMAINNGSRVIAFWRDIDRAKARRVLLGALPTCLLGAYGYTRLGTSAVAAALGVFLLLSVPLRRALSRADYRLGARGLVAASAGFGVLDGGLTGTGVVLVSILMAAGVQGAAIVGTDAMVSMVMGMAKTALFGGVARLDAELALAGVLVGACTTPGAFVARRLLAAIPLRVHTGIMDGVVLAGGAGFLWRAVA